MADIEAAKAAFERFDVNGDGQISAAEYKSTMAALGNHYVTEELAKSVIKAADSNGDGLISWDEFWATQQS
ncbi:MULTISPECIES: EF-hand domain-containing protein [Peterkaempfera]|uniref:EF-hand domain-containing protein n=1 Tax=Peterkaempfera TaxID=2995704 RepID=UPI0006E453DB|nr:EF-hand domain-containing protein [Peterkaempfera griseoplana]